MGKSRSFGAHVRWSDCEITALVSMYASASANELKAILPERRLRVIHCKAHSLGLKRPKVIKRSDSETREAKRSGMARHRAEDPERTRQYQKHYRAQRLSSEQRRQREYCTRRFFWARAGKLKGENRANYRDLARIWKRQIGKCALTGRKLDRSAQLDHILPKAKGGNDSPSNLRWLCREANYAKRDLMDAEFVQLCADVIHLQSSRR